VGVLLLGAVMDDARWPEMGGRLKPFPPGHGICWWGPGLSETTMRAHKAGLVRSHSIQHEVPDFGQRPAWRLTAPGGLADQD
jgi:hypothetical protein